MSTKECVLCTKLLFALKVQFKIFRFEFDIISSHLRMAMKIIINK